jgi:putative Mn2+ efflux pump MntP
MQNLISIYQWGSVLFFCIGLVLAFIGLMKGDCPIIGHGKFSDSVGGRITVGAGIAMVWPIFLVLVGIDALIGENRPRI